MKFNLKYCFLSGLLLIATISGSFSNSGSENEGAVYCPEILDVRSSKDVGADNKCPKVSTHGGSDENAANCTLYGVERDSVNNNGRTYDHFYFPKEKRPKLDKPKKFSFFIRVYYGDWDSYKGRD